MAEIYSTSPSSRSTYSSKKLREMKKKALQSYKKISTIKQRSDREKQLAADSAERELNSFIQKI